MLELTKTGIKVVDATANDASLGTNLMSMKFTDGSAIKNGSEIKEFPTTMKAISTGFVSTGGATWIYEKDEKSGKRKAAYEIIYTPDGAPSLVRDRRKEIPTLINLDTFAKEAGLEQGINRAVIARIAESIVLKSLQEEGKILLRGNNKNVVMSGVEANAVKLGAKSIEGVSLTNSTKEIVMSMMQSIYSSLEPHEEQSLSAEILQHFKSERAIADAKNIIENLKAGTIGTLDIGYYVPFTMKTMSMLENDATDDVENQEYVKYVQQTLGQSKLKLQDAVTKVGGHVFAIVPSIKEPITIDYSMVSTNATKEQRDKDFEHNKNFSKSSKAMATRKAISKFISEKPDERSGVTKEAIEKAYKTLFEETLPEFMSKGDIAELKAILDMDKNRTRNSFGKIMGTAILREKEAFEKKSGEPKVSGLGLPYEVAMSMMQPQIGGTNGAVITINAHTGVWKKDDTKPSEITTAYSISSVQTKDKYITMQNEKTLPERLSYAIQDFLKMDKNGKYEYETIEKNEKIKKNKTVDVQKVGLDLIAKLEIAQENPKNKGLISELNELIADIKTSLSGENTIEVLQKNLNDSKKPYASIIAASNAVNIPAMNAIFNGGYVASRYAEQINAFTKNATNAISSGKIEQITKPNYKISSLVSKNEASQHRSLLQSLSLSIVSAIDNKNKALTMIEGEAAGYEEYVKYCESKGLNPRNKITFSPLVDQAEVVASSLRARVNPGKSLFIPRIPRTANSCFLKDTMVLRDGKEYKAKEVASVEEIEANIKEAKAQYIAAVSTGESIVKEVIKNFNQNSIQSGLAMLREEKSPRVPEASVSEVASSTPTSAPTAAPAASKEKDKGEPVLQRFGATPVTQAIEEVVVPSVETETVATAPEKPTQETGGVDEVIRAFESEQNTTEDAAIENAVFEESPEVAETKEAVTEDALNEVFFDNEAKMDDEVTIEDSLANAESQEKQEEVEIFNTEANDISEIFANDIDEEIFNLIGVGDEDDFDLEIDIDDDEIENAFGFRPNA